MMVVVLLLLFCCCCCAEIFINFESRPEKTSAMSTKFLYISLVVLFCLLHTILHSHLKFQHPAELSWIMSSTNFPFSCLLFASVWLNHLFNCLAGEKNQNISHKPDQDTDTKIKYTLVISIHCLSVDPDVGDVLRQTLRVFLGFFWP